LADWQKQLMQLGQQFERRLGERDQELSGKSIEVLGGAGLVRVQVDGHGRIRNLVIDPAAFEGRDHELLADLILGTVAEAQRRADTLRNDARATD
jgi:DNA-binding protein YbaB